MASALSFSSRVSNVSPFVADSRAAAGVPRSSAHGAPLLARPCCALLETKSLAELRALARERGLRGDTRSELLKLLSTSPASGSNGAANGATRTAAPQSGTFDMKTLQNMPMAQLRAVARSRGVQGDTREDIIRRLTAAGPGPSAAASSAPSAPSYSAPASSQSGGGAATASTFSRQQLLSKTLPALRALARTKGVPNAAGATKEQLVQALASPSNGAPPAAASAPAAPAWTPPPAPSAPAAPPAPAGSGTVGGSSVPLSDLQVMTLGQLRALGKQYGIRGDTKAELIRLLSSTPSSSKPAAAPAAAAPKRTTATAVAEPQTLPAAEASLPPFQSVVSTSSALEPVKLASEVSALRKAMEDMEARDKLLEQERQSLVEQADFLRNVLVGGIGLAAVPLLLPFQNAFSPSASTSTSPSAPAPTTTSLVIPSAAPAPKVPATPAPPPAPVVKEVSPEDYCGSVPSALLSPQVAKFCEALIEPSF